jgi:hypothetical protein
MVLYMFPCNHARAPASAVSPTVVNQFSNPFVAFSAPTKGLGRLKKAGSCE